MSQIQELHCPKGAALGGLSMDAAHFVVWRDWRLADVSGDPRSGGGDLIEVFCTQESTSGGLDDVEAVFV